ncbi:MAG: sulfatase [Fibrobacterota bacterium]
MVTKYTIFSLMSNPRIWYWLVPVLLWISDLLFRHAVIARYRRLEAAFYTASILFSFLLYKGLLFLLHSVRASARFQRAHLFFCLLIGFLYTFTHLGSYGYYLAMGILPNYYTFEYFRTQPYNSWTLFRDSFTPVAGFLFILLTTLFSVALFRITRGPHLPFSWPWPMKALHALLLITLTLTFNNNVRFVDQCFVADVNAFSFAGRHVYNRVFNPGFGSSGLLARNRVLLKEKHANPGYNVLLVLTESLRSQNLSIYSYNRATTPFLSALKAAQPGSFFQFDRAFSNSSSTLLSFPSILTGVSPVQSSLRFHSAPFFFEYAATAGYATFLISAQDYHWYNMNVYLATPDLGLLWDKEASGFPAVNDLGMDDRKTVDRFEAYLVAQKGRPFAGMLHFNATHYPYVTPEEYRPFGTTTPQDKYDNAIFLQDALIQRVFDALERNGLRDRTMVIIASDHGEGFKEHGFLGHRDFFYREVVQVPLLFVIPKELQTRLDTAVLRKNLLVNVSNIDILPTLVDFLHLSGSPEVRAVLAELPGQSLLTSVPPERAILISNNNEIARYREGLSLVRGDLHYMMHLNRLPRREELYNLAHDPDETDNLWPGLTETERESFRTPFASYPFAHNLQQSFVRSAR